MTEEDEFEPARFSTRKVLILHLLRAEKRSISQLTDDLNGEIEAELTESQIASLVEELHREGVLEQSGGAESQWATSAEGDAWLEARERWENEHVGEAHLEDGWP